MGLGLLLLALGLIFILSRLICLGLGCSLLLGGRLLLSLGGLAAGQVIVQAQLCIVPAELLHQVIQLVLFQVGAALLALGAHGSQLIQHLLGGHLQVLCKITHSIFYGHSLISSSCSVAPQAARRSKQSFARLRSVTAYTATARWVISASCCCVSGIWNTSTSSSTA